MGIKIYQDCSKPDRFSRGNIVDIIIQKYLIQQKKV